MNLRRKILLVEFLFLVFAKSLNYFSFHAHNFQPTTNQLVDSQILKHNLLDTNISFNGIQQVQDLFSKLQEVSL